MALNLDAVGIQSVIGGTLCESFDQEKKVSEALALNCDGGFGAAATFDPMYEFSIKGKGDLAAAYVIGGSNFTFNFSDLADPGDTGAFIYTSIKEGEKNDDFNSWEVSGVCYPGATPIPVV